MSMYRLVNVPTCDSGLEIRGIVKGEDVLIVASKKNADPDDWIKIADFSMGDHFWSGRFTARQLREIIAGQVASAITSARDAGYSQAMAKVRQTIGIKE